MIYVYSYLSENVNIASFKYPVGLLLTISQLKHLNSEPEFEAVTTYELFVSSSQLPNSSQRDNFKS